jgi:protein-tyrosine phosphatase
MGQLYVRLVSEPGPLAALKVMFEHLAEPDGAPVLYHCSAGKDRTGVTCALILAALGVDRADIDADFMLTQRYYGSEEARRQRIAQIVEEAGLGFWSEAALVPIFTVEQAYLDTALGIVDEAGGIERFLAERVGVGRRWWRGLGRRWWREGGGPLPLGRDAPSRFRPAGGREGAVAARRPLRQPAGLTSPAARVRSGAAVA